MFVYQDGKLYAEVDNKLVGVSITPTGVSTNKYTTTFVDGQVLTLDEVLRKFGVYTFPELGEENGTVEDNEKVVKPTRRKSK